MVKVLACATVVTIVPHINVSNPHVVDLKLT